MQFEKKKIHSETLGEYLTEIRQKLGLSVEQVANKTGITAKFLEALENSEPKILPADVYVYGFLKELSVLYAVSPQPLIEQYKKERGIEQQLYKKTESFGNSWYNKYFKKLVITPKILSLFLGLIFVAATVAYIIWQVWSINRTPSLKINQPINNTVVESSSVQVSGKTDPGMAVLVNGQNLFVDSQGSFQTQLGLNPGPTEIVITAKNRFNKSVSQTIDITGAAAQTNNTGQLQLKIDFTAAVTLGVGIDNQAEQTLTFNQGDSKIFSAQNQILISTSDAGATKISLNGQAMGAMGRPKEQLTNVLFFASSTTTMPVSK